MVSELDLIGQSYGYENLRLIPRCERDTGNGITRVILDSELPLSVFTVSIGVFF